MVPMARARARAVKNGGEPVDQRRIHRADMGEEGLDHRLVVTALPELTGIEGAHVHGPCSSSALSWRCARRMFGWVRYPPFDYFLTR